VLRFDTGDRVDVVGRGVIGRNPAAPTDENLAHLVPISDSGRTVSKSHLDFGVEDGRLWVMDRGSTNGTAVVDPHGGERTLEPGAKTPVEAGSTVRFGDRSFTVESE
jgi:predicted component of type VI protein secretion system